jgi:hypothetical protein
VREREREREREVERDDGSGGSSLQESATTLLLLLLVVYGHCAVDLANEVVEDLIDIDLGLGRSLEEGATTKLLGKTLTLLLRDDSLILEITLVTDKNHGHRVAVLDAKNLLPEIGQVVEGRLGNDTVNQHETLTVLHVEITHSRELLGTGSIENLEHVLVVVYLDGLAVTVFDGRIILFDEDTLYELDSKSALADTTRTENDNFVVWHYEVCRRPRRTSKERNERCVEERESAREGGLRIQERERRRAEVEKGAGKQTTKHKQ